MGIFPGIGSVEDTMQGLHVAIDSGSRGTRTVLFDPSISEIDTGEILDLPAAYAELDNSEDISSIRGKPTVYDQLEMVISDTTIGKDENKYFDKPLRIIKGSLLNERNSTIVYMMSQSGKIDQKALFVNIVSNVAIRCLLYAAQRGSSFKRFNIDLSCSLPSDDMRVKRKYEEFIRKIQGDYSVRFPRLDNITIDFTISEDSLFVQSEAISAALGYLQKRRDIPSNYRILLIDGGGKSTDVVMIEGNSPRQGSGTASCKFGGAIFEADAAEAVDTELGLDVTGRRAMEVLLETGKVQDGNAYEDACRCLDVAKEKYAHRLFQALQRVLDSAEVRASSINEIVCVGGIFGETKNDVSMSHNTIEFLKREYIQLSPNTIFSLLGRKYPILEGLVVGRYGEGE
jgi:hypothetical protein